VTALLHDALPLATTAAFTPGRAHAIAHAGQWQVALARAAAATELAVPTATRPVAAECTEESRTGPSAAVPLSPDVATRPIATSVPAPRTAGARPAPPAVPHLPVPGLGASRAHPVPTLCGSPALLAAIEASDGAAPLRPNPKSSLASEPPLATRIHVEQHEHAGMTVWLGAEGDPAAVALKAAALLAGLQRVLPLAGHRLARLVCNGVPVYIAPHFEKETS
jgi:hypothetical protein